MTPPGLPFGFDRGKPFYPVVINYAALLWGIKELAGLAMVLRYRGWSEEQLQANPLSPAAERLRTIHYQELMEGLTLLSHSTRQSVLVDTADLAREFDQSGSYLLQHTLLAAGQLLISAYELTADLRQRRRRPRPDHGPLWEFLYHCRNAAAHGGRFTFIGPEPLYRAEWGSLQIEASLQGHPLFGTVDQPGLLFIGDPIHLLADIERAHIP